MCALPTRMARPTTARRSPSGRDRCSCSTAAAWVTVTSSSTPSAPNTVAASRMPWRSIRSPTSGMRKAISSLPWRAVNSATAVKVAASTAVRLSATRTPSTADHVTRLGPSVSSSVTTVTSTPPPTARRIGSNPRSSSGTTTLTTTVSVSASATRERAPRHPPMAITAAEKIAATMPSNGILHGSAMTAKSPAAGPVKQGDDDLVADLVWLPIPGPGMAALPSCTTASIRSPSSSSTPKSGSPTAWCHAPRRSRRGCCAARRRGSPRLA